MQKKATKKTNTLGQRIKQIRKNKGWTQEQLADAIDIHWQSIGVYEKDQSVPSALVIKKIADALGVSADYLLSGAEDTPIQVKNRELLKRFEQLDRLKPEELKTMIDMMDVYINSKAAKELLAKAS